MAWNNDFIQDINRREVLLKCFNVVDKDGYELPYDLIINTLFFNKAFAVSLFGRNKEVGEICGNEDKRGAGCCNNPKCKNKILVDGWEYHLPKLATAENKMKYLSDYLKSLEL